MTKDIGISYDSVKVNRMNLNHLLYFWAVARTGSVTAAAAALGISQPAVSEQLRALEKRLGATLAVRSARGMTLTPSGVRAQRFAEEIVGIYSELVRSLPLQETEEHRPLNVGTADSVPKIVVRSLLSPLLDAGPAHPVLCREWRVDQLLAELALYRLDVVLTDKPIDSTATPELSSFKVGSSEVMICAAPELARRLKRAFPRSLDRAPFLLPVRESALRQSLDRWCTLHRIRPRVVVEAEDRSQLHHFAEKGYGVVPVASITTADLRRQFGLMAVGSPRGVHEDYFAVVVDHRNRHPAIKLLQDRITSAKTKVRHSQPRNRTRGS